VEFGAVQALGDGSIHGLAAHFTVLFSYCKPPVTFSTGPTERTTHWEQTFFPFDAPLIVEKDVIVSGSIRCELQPTSSTTSDVSFLLPPASSLRISRILIGRQRHPQHEQ
jgi:hypothetical protein